MPQQPRRILFDLLSRKGHICWSHNVNKTRLALNFKQIPYGVKWLDFPDIEPQLRLAGFPAGEPEPSGAKKGLRFTLPTIRLPDGQFVRDSLAIAQTLEKLKPEPSLRLQDGKHVALQSCVNGVLRALLPETVQCVRDDIVTENAKSWWLMKRERFLGESIDSFVRRKPSSQVWEEARAELRKLGEEMRAGVSTGAPFVLGEDPSYGDFVVVGMLQYLKCLSEDRLFPEVMSSEARLQDLYKRCQRWL